MINKARAALSGDPLLSRHENGRERLGRGATKLTWEPENRSIIFASPPSSTKAPRRYQVVIDALEVAQQVEPLQDAADGYDNDPLNDIGQRTRVAPTTTINLNSC